MRSWLILLGGLLVWTVHFFGLYAIAEIAPHSALVLGLTAVCVAADLWLLRGSRRLPAREAFSAWRRSVATGGALLSLVAVGWQALPALVG
jgi:hypothetical protein